jgi:hypothetical protein
MATQLTVSETIDVTDAKVLAAQVFASLQPDGIALFLLDHPELTEQQLRTIAGMTSSYWLLVFLRQLYLDEKERRPSIKRLRVIMERMGPCEIVSFLRSCPMWIDQEVLHMALERTNSYWNISLLEKDLSSCRIWSGLSYWTQPENKEQFGRVVDQSDHCETVRLLQCLIRNRPRQKTSYMEYFHMIVQKTDPKRLVRFLKTYSPELTGDEFRMIIKYADLKQLIIFRKSEACSTLTEEKILMIEEKIDPQGVGIPLFAASHDFKPSSIEEPGPSTSCRVHPYRRVFDKSVIARLSPTQLRRWINHCDPGTVAAYFVENFPELSDVSFGIFVENIHPERLTLFLQNNYVKLTEQQFHMVIEELDNTYIMSFWENHLSKLTDVEHSAKRRMAFCMAIAWTDSNKVMQILKDHFSKVTVEEFYIITDRVDFLSCDDTGNLIHDFWDQFGQFFRDHLLQLTDEQLYIMIMQLSTYTPTFCDFTDDMEFQEKYFLQTTDERFAIIQWECRLDIDWGTACMERQECNSNGDIFPLFRLARLTPSKLRIQLGVMIEMGIQDGFTKLYPGTDDDMYEHVFDDFPYLKDDQFRKVMEIAPLDDVLSFFKRRSAELTDEQRRIVATRMSES